MNLTPCLETERIENSVLKVCNYISNKKRKSKNWYSCTEEKLWHELVSCILGSRVRYETAKACTNHLIDIGLLDVSHILNEPNEAEKRIMEELSKSIYPPIANGRGCKYRYPKTKTRFIVKTGLEIYRENNSSIKSLLKKCDNAYEAREILINKCMGIGPKQASLFLRNISYCNDLAIIDSHVIDYMKLINLNKEIETITIANKKQYLMNENILLSYATKRNKTLATLDIAIWVVMRVVKREFVI